MAGMAAIADACRVHIDDVMGDADDVNMSPGDVMEVVATIFDEAYVEIILDTNIVDCRSICVAGVNAYVADAQQQWIYQPKPHTLAPVAEA